MAGYLQGTVRCLPAWRAGFVLDILILNEGGL
jgi:hypothetical protein